VSPLSRRAVFPLLVGSLGLACSVGPGCRGLGGGTSAAHRALDAGISWLLAQQAASGAFHSTTYGLLKGGESLTPAVLLALLDAEPITTLPLQPALRVGLSFLATKTDSRGAIGLSGSAPDYPVYATAMAVRAASRAGLRGALPTFDRNVDWLTEQQLTAARGWTDHPARGGWPMGGTHLSVPGQAGHVDLSMTRRALQALAATEPLKAAARADALGFVSSSQADGGGFVYSRPNPGLNKAGPSKGYGSATCDGLLALAALGIGDDDPRVKRGLRFLRKIHRPDRNPGLSGGSFAAFAVAMKGYYRAASAEVFARWGWPEGGAEGMVAAVLADQRPGGFWQSPDVLQKEDDPLISTAFALQALAGALPAATHSR
jgi:hypothetical protein